MYIEIKNLFISIKGVEVLHDINIRLEGGKVYGIRGKNGCGKTMLMRCISGLIKPTQGEIDINGQKLGIDMSFPDSIGVLIENPAFLSNYTGFDNLKMLASIKGIISDGEINEALISVGLNPEDYRKYRKYSLGMKQKLGIACAIMEHPDIVILDEPINAIDENGVELVRSILKKLKDNNTIVLLACHDKEELELLSDEIFIMEEGKITSHENVKKEHEMGKNNGIF